MNKFPTTFTPVSEKLTMELGLYPALVYGRIWRYCQDTEGVCRAGVERIAKELGISGKTVERAIKVLEAEGYILDKTPTLRNRPHLYYCTKKLAEFASETDSQSDPLRLSVVPTQTQSLTHSDSESDEDRSKREDKREKETRSQKAQADGQKPYRQVASGLSGLPDPDGVAGEIIEKLRNLTGCFFFRDKKTLEAAQFIAEREANGESLETFLGNRPPERISKYPSFPLDICKEWREVFAEIKPHFLEGV